MQAANSTTPQVKIAIIGAGFGGLAMAIRLLQNNIRDFVILEKASVIGGTWRENQYPGAACDVQSHLYSLSFSPKTDCLNVMLKHLKFINTCKHLPLKINCSLISAFTPKSVLHIT